MRNEPHKLCDALSLESKMDALLVATTSLLGELGLEVKGFFLGASTGVLFKSKCLMSLPELGCQQAFTACDCNDHATTQRPESEGPA